MPGKKTPNLTKLRSPPGTNNLSSKKQVTISKFFTSASASSHTADGPTADADHDVEIVTDDIDSRKGSNTSNERKVHSPIKKRQREFDSNGTHTSSSKRHCNDQNIPSFVSYKGHGAGTSSNQDVSNGGSKCFGKPTERNMRQLCDSTISKLWQFEQKDVNENSKNNIIDLQDLIRSSHFKEKLYDAISSDVADQVVEISDNECDNVSANECLPSTSCSSKLAKFSSLTHKHEVNKRTKSKYTPLELQYIEIKNKNPDTLLFVECGYKYRFFGDDAEIAARVLKIFCHEDHNFMTASIPTHRLFVHVRRLVAAGYKVGVVKQMETAALKAVGDNKSAPFTRQLAALYTKSTLIGEDVDSLAGVEDSSSDNSTSLSSFLMCIYDVPPDKEIKSHTIGIMAVQPSTGEVVYDSFEDTDTRGELETRICHIQPVEILVPYSTTEDTEKLINRIVATSDTADDRMRVEKREDEQFVYSKALEVLSKFYTPDKDKNTLQDAMNLPQSVISCLSCLINYLTEFNLHKVLSLTSNFNKFSVKSAAMQLSGNTVRNLELFQNLTDGREKGSLFWMMNQTVTNFGGRMLKSWLAKPLLSAAKIKERQMVVQELIGGPCSLCLKKFRAILGKIPDLEKGLCSIYHRKCSVQEFYTVCRAFDQVCDEIKLQTENICQQSSSNLLQQIIEDLPKLLHDIHSYSSAINSQAVKENDKTNLFTNEAQFPAIVQRKGEIAEVLSEIKGHRRDVRLLLKMPSLEFVTVMATEFLIEVKNTNLKLVPSDWVKVSSTKAVSRYHSPFIEKKYKKLNQLREQLKIDSNGAWMEFLEWFGEGYQRYAKAVQYLAMLDCFFSLAAVAEHHGFCRPEIVEDENCIEIENGRHPIIHQLIGEHSQYVPNSTHLSTTNERVMVITGPNMGGKSSYIKQVALMTILAQVGSFVPADSAKIGLIDTVYTRMGASDEIYKGRSTFMVELQEASEIMAKATSRSLVIIDELGRGTSTHDGVAIAFATLDYFIRTVKCISLFVTHFPLIAEFEKSFPGVVKNYHMSFLLEDKDDDEASQSGSDSITFLYQLVSGMAARSYGLNVAQLANVPESIIRVAMEKSQELEGIVSDRRSQQQIFQALITSSKENVMDVLHEFHTASTS